MMRASRPCVLALAAVVTACGPDVVTLDLAGRVLDAETEQPIAGAVVLLTWDRGVVDVQAVATDTGSDGGYRLWMSEFACDGPALTAGLDPWDAQTKDVRCVGDPQVIDFLLTR